MPRDWAFGARTIARKEIVVIADVAKDPEFAAGTPGAGGPMVRFFAGAPLLTAEGQALGAICVVDRRARKTLSGHERQLLQHLADMVMEQIELRRGLKRARASITKVARLTGGGKPSADEILSECDKALEALQAVHDLTTRSARKRVRLMTPKH